MNKLIKDAEIKVESNVSRIGERKKRLVEYGMLRTETRKTLRRWKNQKTTRDFLKVRETYKSKYKDRKASNEERSTKDKGN